MSGELIDNVFRLRIYLGLHMAVLDAQWLPTLCMHLYHWWPTH